jgi:hypothetical protein
MKRKGKFLLILSVLFAGRAWLGGLVVLLAGCPGGSGRPSTLERARQCVKDNTGWHRDEFMKSYVERLVVTDSIALPGDTAKVYHLEGGMIDVNDPAIVYNAKTGRMHFVHRSFNLGRHIGMLWLPHEIPYLDGMASDLDQLEGFLRSEAPETWLTEQQMVDLLQAVYRCTPEQAKERLPYIWGYLVTKKIYRDRDVQWPDSLLQYKK